MLAALPEVARGVSEMLRQRLDNGQAVPEVQRWLRAFDEAVQLLPSADELRQAGGISSSEARSDPAGLTFSSRSEVPLAP